MASGLPSSRLHPSNSLFTTTSTPEAPKCSSLNEPSLSQQHLRSIARQIVAKPPFPVSTKPPDSAGHNHHAETPQRLPSKTAAIRLRFHLAAGSVEDSIGDRPRLFAQGSGAHLWLWSMCHEKGQKRHKVSDQLTATGGDFCFGACPQACASIHYRSHHLIRPSRLPAPPHLSSTTRKQIDCAAAPAVECAKLELACEKRTDVRIDRCASNSDRVYSVGRRLDLPATAPLKPNCSSFNPSSADGAWIRQQRQTSALTGRVSGRS